MTAAGYGESRGSQHPEELGEDPASAQDFQALLPLWAGPVDASQRQGRRHEGRCRLTPRRQRPPMTSPEVVSPELRSPLKASSLGPPRERSALLPSLHCTRPQMLEAELTRGASGGHRDAAVGSRTGTRVRTFFWAPDGNCCPVSPVTMDQPNGNLRDPSESCPVRMAHCGLEDPSLGCPPGSVQDPGFPGTHFPQQHFP